MKKATLTAVALVLVVITALVLFTNFGRPAGNTDNSAAQTTPMVTAHDANKPYSVIIEISGGATYKKIETLAGTKLLDLMTILQKNDKTFSFKTDKASFGEFVTTINGVKADSTKEFWNIKVNGVDSQVGVSDLVVKGNDVFTFSLVKF